MIHEVNITTDEGNEPGVWAIKYHPRAYPFITHDVMPELAHVIDIINEILLIQFNFFKSISKAISWLLQLL